ncbi:MAG: ABC transporter permease [Candidatus Babeliales bacterium]
MELHRIKAIFYRLVRADFLNAAKMFDDIFWPSVDILMIGMMAVWFQNSQPGGVNILLILLVNDTLWQSLIRANHAIAMNILAELFDKNLVNLFSTPLVIGEWLVAGMSLALLKAFFVTLLCSVLCLIFYGTNIFVLGPLLFVGVISLFMFGLITGLFSASLIIYGGQRYQSAAWSMCWLVAPFCAVFYPLAILPAWMQYIGLALPPTYFFEGVRTFVASDVMPYKLLAINFLLNIVYLGGALALFRSAFEKSRDLGLARLE